LCDPAAKADYERRLPSRRAVRSDDGFGVHDLVMADRQVVFKEVLLVLRIINAWSSSTPPPAARPPRQRRLSPRIHWTSPVSRPRTPIPSTPAVAIMDRLQPGSVATAGMAAAAAILVGDGNGVGGT